MRIFETHAHLLDTAFDPDREEILSKMKEKGIQYSVEACCNINQIKPILELHEKHPFVLPTAGMHPEEIDADAIAQLPIIEKAASSNKLYAIGEIGLDYHYEDMCPKETQKQIFDAQLSIAAQYNLPVIIHDRDAHGDCMDIIKAHKGSIYGIMHCFSGSWEMAKECLNAGLHLGFGGVITFKNSKKVKTVLENIPAEGIMFETDCPYMAPEPFRGQKNDPSLLPYIIKAAATIRNEDMEYLSEVVFQNSLNLFGIKNFSS